MASVTKAVFAVLLYIQITRTSAQFDQQYHLDQQQHFQAIQDVLKKQEQMQQLTQSSYERQNNQQLEEFQDILQNRPTVKTNQRHDLLPHTISPQQYQQTQQQVLLPELQQAEKQVLHPVQHYQHNPQILHPLQQTQHNPQVLHTNQQFQQTQEQILHPLQQTQQIPQILHTNQQYQQTQGQVLHPVQQHHLGGQQILHPSVQQYQQTSPKQVVLPVQQTQYNSRQMRFPIQQHLQTPRQINQQLSNFGMVQGDELDEEDNENFEEENENVPRIFDFLIPQQGNKNTEESKSFQIPNNNWQTSPVFNFWEVQNDDLDDETESKTDSPRNEALEPTRQQNLQLYRQLKPVHQENKLFDQDKQSQNQNSYQVTPDVAQYFRRCRYSSSDFDSCMVKILNQLNFLFPTGAPEYDIPPFDPFFANEVKVSRSGPLMSFTLKLTDVLESGWTMSTVTGFKSDLKKRRVTVKQTWPDKRLAGGYIIEGKMFGNFVFRNKGKFNLTLLGFNQTTQLTRLLGEYDDEGAPLIKCQVNIQGVDNLRLHITNLLFGARGFEYVLDGIINATWRPFYPLTKPLVNELVSKAFTKIFTRAFRRVPFEYFFVA